MEEVRFIKGTQEEYDKYTKKEGAVFKISNTDASVSSSYNQTRMYIDDTLVGDAYVSEKQVDDITSSQIGGIDASTSLKDILSESNGSISKVLDKVLFGETKPQVVENDWEQLK